jgi:hypothetical protein
MAGFFFLQLIDQQSGPEGPHYLGRWAGLRVLA